MKKMNDSENEIYITTPERKRAYIERWLSDNPHGCTNLDNEIHETRPPDSPKKQEKCATSVVYSLSPVQEPSAICTVTKSPILGGKRLASSPIIGGKRRFIKRTKVVKKLNTTYTKENFNSDSKIQTVLQSETLTKIQDNSDKKIFKNNDTMASTVKVGESDFDFTFDDSRSFNQNEVGTKKILRIVKNPFDDTASQLIESVSSTQDTSAGQNIQEANSDTDKTMSDLIEDISTQVVSIKSKNEIPTSQKISNPSSPSSNSETDVHISEIITTEVSSNMNSLQMGTQSDKIDTISTLDSRIDFAKSSYILQHVPEKSKKKITYEKGGLLDTLLTTLAKEKSNVNLFRHQVCKKIMETCTDDRFILLQIVEHLPMINGFQLLKCILLEDSADLLNGLLNEKRFISVINVPEISSLVNTKEKPALKVYEPWTVIDPNQLILHITKFIAIPSNSKNQSLINENLFKADLKSVQEFYCPCIDEKRLSNKCEMKFRDCSYNVVKTIFNYK